MMCTVMSWCALSCHGVYCHAIVCHVMACHGLRCMCNSCVVSGVVLFLDKFYCITLLEHCDVFVHIFCRNYKSTILYPAPRDKYHKVMQW